MEWWVALLIIFGGFLVLLATGLPVALCFAVINLVGVFLFWGGLIGLRQLILSLAASVGNFTLLPLPLFVLMGEVMYRSGVAPRMLDVLDKWLGRLPGRLSLLAVAGGTLFATLSGAAVAGVAMLGSTLVPDMEKRGYKKPMSIGPILASGSLAIMIPPSSLAVLLASLGQMSIAGLLVAIIVPGIVMAAFYATYVIIRCRLQPSIAPSYEVAPVPLSEKVVLTGRYVVPLGSIIFLVLGLMFLGIATPTESSALGALGCFVLAAIYKGLNWETVKKSVGDTISITGMMFLILTGSTAFSQMLAFSGATKGLLELAISLPLSPLFILIGMQIILLVLGTFMDPLSMAMVTMPIYMPIVHSLGFEPVWFGAIVLLNMEMATRSPPFGLCLFVMKGVAPPDTTMGDIYKAALPFLGLDLIVMALMIAFPPLSLWLPSVMH